MARLSVPGPGPGGLLVALGLMAGGLAASAAEPRGRVVRVVALGDSVTKGVRPGVRPEDTFASLAERALKADGIEVEVVNLGVGGERTDQARKRLDSAAEHHPRVATVMYGTNDSYVDRGANASRITRDEYRANLKAIVAGLLVRGIEPILMTEPRWADDAPPNGLGENPNVRLSSYMDACREVAAECRVPLVDHFTRWSEARSKGRALADWTTDGCHPNPQGHRELAAALLPALRDAFRPAPRPLGLASRLDTVLTRDDGQFQWYHPRPTPIPNAAGDAAEVGRAGHRRWPATRPCDAISNLNGRWWDRGPVGACGGRGRPPGDRLVARLRSSSGRVRPRSSPGWPNRSGRRRGVDGAMTGRDRSAKWVTRDPTGFGATTSANGCSAGVSVDKPPRYRGPTRPRRLLEEGRPKGLAASIPSAFAIPSRNPGGSGTEAGGGSIGRRIPRPAGTASARRRSRPAGVPRLEEERWETGNPCEGTLGKRGDLEDERSQG